MRKNSLAVLQIALFLVISAGCAYYVATNVLGPQDIRPIEVTVRMPNSGGMATGSPVTYRGVPVGEVAGSEIDQEGVVLRLKIDPRQRIPASTRAVVSMDTPLALQHLDLQPADQAPPHLRDGSVIEADKTEAPLPLTAVLTEFAQLSDSLHEEDISVAAEALATGFHGTGPELARLLDNAPQLLELANSEIPRAREMAHRVEVLTGPDAEQVKRIRSVAEKLRETTDELRAHEPQLRTLATTAPEVADQLTRLAADAQPAVTALLGNLVTTSQVISMRGPAVEQLIIALPEALRKVSSIVHGDTADFYLVGTQGPACYTGAERRPPTETAEREPDLHWHCPADEPNLQQRGAANAPRPITTTYDPQTGATSAGFRVGTTSAPGMWYTMQLNGVR
ncbi:MlaD family protein [Saccharopolyspora rectivirgula]|jgi:phospholipid/cholesterol/gamma-HCH transport system substrate-binding protein|uniref:MCE family protein n=1 Tax=Saccharopolyspora rectivirgula TaxID=28042 RepID=A0A073BDE9_9PSEU|nr:MlaD family protein [Saccharopolyspora rectivirgula]KEI45794.1 hypothetical protein GU90_02615 [Saccharopolyspora rectivirgula]